VSLPDPLEEHLISLVRRQARRYGDRTFMSFGDGRHMSFADLERRIAGVRGWLTERGIAPGDRVGLMLKNSLFYPVAWLGSVSAGAVAVPVNSRLGPIDARYVLDHAGVTVLIADDATETVARAAARAGVRETFVVRTADPMEGFSADPDTPAPPLSGASIANIQYTSGTTGFPKGCILTHGFWQWMGATSVEVMGLRESDVLLTSQPHSYIDPQWNVIAALRSGAQLVLLDGFHPSTFMRSVAEWGVTVFYCIGAMPTLLLKQPSGDRDANNALERVYSSGIPREHHAAIEGRWGVPWYELFGMSETGVNVAVGPADHDRLVGSGCIGRALPHNEALVVDEEDREVPAEHVGELVLRGVGYMEGYHRDPVATAAFFRGGWAHTGDLVRRDREGLFYYEGRRKEMIRRGGENIAPAEIEAALTTHPDVIECATAPVPDPDLGEEIKVYVVMRRGTAAAAAARAAELADYLSHRIAPFKVPRFWEFRSELPHTPSEKVAKADLERGREDWRDGTVDVKRQG
jgi:carnitine-CoA ligase